MSPQHCAQQQHALAERDPAGGAPQRAPPSATWCPSGAWSGARRARRPQQLARQRAERASAYSPASRAVHLARLIRRLGGLAVGLGALAAALDGQAARLLHTWRAEDWLSADAGLVLERLRAAPAARPAARQEPGPAEPAVQLRQPAAGGRAEFRAEGARARAASCLPRALSPALQGGRASRC